MSGYEVYLGIHRENPKEWKCEELLIHIYDSHTYHSIFAFGNNEITALNVATRVNNLFYKITFGQNG